MRDYTQQLTVEQFGGDGPDREPDRRLPARPISRVHARRRTASRPLRSDTGTKGRSRLRGPSDRHPRVGQDGRLAGDRVRSRAPGIARGGLRSEARPRAGAPARARRPAAGARAVRRRGAARATRPARDRACRTSARSWPCSYLLELAARQPRAVGERRLARGEGHRPRGITQPAARCRAAPGLRSCRREGGRGGA